MTGRDCVSSCRASVGCAGAERCLTTVFAAEPLRWIHEGGVIAVYALREMMDHNKK